MTGTLALTVTIDAAAVGWYAAIVATLSAVVGGYAIWRDRVRLKISAAANMRLTAPDRNVQTGENLIFITAANVGRRPVTLGLAWFERKGQKDRSGLVVKPSWEPSGRIGEGESATKVLSQKDLDISTLKRVVVRDATGRKWYGPIENRGGDAEQRSDGKHQEESHSEASADDAARE